MSEIEYREAEQRERNSRGLDRELHEREIAGLRSDVAKWQRKTGEAREQLRAVEEIERLRGVIAEAVDAIQERRVEDAIQMLLNALDTPGSDIERAGVEAKTVEDGKTPDEQTALDYWRERALAAEVLARAAERDLRGPVALRNAADRFLVAWDRRDGSHFSGIAMASAVRALRAAVRGR